MFYVELKQRSNNKAIYEIDSFLDCRVKFDHHILNWDALIARGTSLRKVFAFIRQDASNVQKIIQPSIVYAERNSRTLNVCEGNHPANFKDCMVYKDL